MAKVNPIEQVATVTARTIDLLKSEGKGLTEVQARRAIERAMNQVYRG